MALATTLMAVGISAEQANRLGYEDRVPLDGNGTTQANATEIIATNTNVAVGTSVGDTAFILPSDAEYFQPYFVLNTTAEPALIFPPVGDTIDDNAVDAAVEIDTDLARVFMRVEEGRWVSMPSGEGGGGVQSIVAGTGISVDSTDPKNPAVSNAGVLSVTAGSNISITGTAQNPVINASTSGGTVTSVGLSAPADLSVTGSPVTTSGTLALDWATPPTGTGAMVRATSPALAGTPTAPTAAVDTNTTQIATTAMVLGQAASATPLGNAATAVVGTSTRYARADHVHPGREVLTANRTYYVATTGSNSNDGLSPGSPFLTLQKAFDTIASIDGGGYTLTIQGVSAPAFSENMLCNKYLVGVAGIALDLNGGSLTGTVSVTRPMRVTVQNGTYQNTANHPLSVDGASCEIIIGASVTLGTSTGMRQMNAVNNGKVTANTAYTIAGSAAYHYFAQLGGIVANGGAAVTVSGTPAFSASFAYADTGGTVSSFPGSFSGSATGKRYDAVNGGIINTFGSGANYFPGSVAGTGTNFGVAPYGLYA